METLRSFTGEFIGTFLMVFFGVGAIMATVLFGSLSGTLQIALTWGIAIALAIFATRNLSNAHFNTAVSLAMVLAGRMPARKLPVYITAQLLGALAASALLLAVFYPSIQQAVDLAGGFSQHSAIETVFLGSYPNTANAVVTAPIAFAVEAIGVFLLVTLIFSLTEGANLGRPDSNLAPIMIGLTVAIIIVVFGPLNNAGLNPARDLGPRIVGALAGWNSYAFTWEIIAVYVGGPLVGAVAAALALRFVIEPMIKRRDVEMAEASRVGANKVGASRAGATKVEVNGSDV
jgi:glycerol uptake facilitator protein